MSNNDSNDKNETDTPSQDSPMSSNNASFLDMLRNAKQGDRAAINRLCDLSQNYLLLIANQNLDAAMLQKFGASDMVQQSMIVANNKIGGFQGHSKGEFFAWIKQILLNECRHATRGYRGTEKRNVGKEQARDAATLDQPSFQLKDQFLTPSSEAISNEQMRLVSQVLKQLPEIDRQVIEMRNWQELSFDEIGVFIDKSADAARKIWSRAILKMEEQLRRIGAI